MKNFNTLYVVPRCYTGSDRYYELLASHVPNTDICWLPKYYTFFPPLLFIWRFFSKKFQKSKIIHTNCEFGIYLFSFKRKLVVTFHHNIFAKLNFKNLQFYKKIFYIFFAPLLFNISMRLAKKIILIQMEDYKIYSNIAPLKNKCVHIWNGIDDTELLDIRPDFFQKKTNKIRILFVGKKSIRKWWDLVQDILLLPGADELDLYCVSMDGYKQKKAFFTDLGTLERVDLLRLMKSVDIVFLPSRIEGFSYTIAEALSLWTCTLARNDWGWFWESYGNLFQVFGTSDSPKELLLLLCNLSEIAKNPKAVFIPRNMNILHTSKSYFQLYSEI